MLDILAQKNPNVSSLVVAERPNTDTVRGGGIIVLLSPKEPLGFYYEVLDKD